MVQGRTGAFFCHALLALIFSKRYSELYPLLVLSSGMFKGQCSTLKGRFPYLGIAQLRNVTVLTSDSRFSPWENGIAVED